MNSVKFQNVKSLLFFYTLMNYQSKTKKKKKDKILSKIPSERIKYLIIKFTKEARDLYFENYKTMMKETENDTKKWKDIPCSCIGRMLLLLLLSRFSCIRLCATPQTAARQAPPSLGFSRQEHWSGLPFASPMHESEKWKWSCSVVSDS